MTPWRGLSGSRTTTKSRPTVEPPALTPSSSIGSGSPQDMTHGRPRRAEKGYIYICEMVRETGGREWRMLTTPPGARQPATGDAIGGCLVSIAEVELGKDALHMILDRVLADYQTLGDLGVGEARHH